MTCIVCADATDNRQRARVGDTVGPICTDCAEWCDGNLIETVR